MIVVTAQVWPHGEAPDSDYGKMIAARDGTLDLVNLIIGNDGTGVATGPDQGGYGNYNVWEGKPNRTRTETVYWKHIGRIEGVERGPDHRCELIMRGLELLAESRGEVKPHAA